MSFFLLLFVSCTQEDLMKYDQSERTLYIPSLGSDQAPPFYSFRHHLDVDNCEALFLVKLNGQLLEEDKKYKVEVVKEKTTALPEDYTLVSEQVFHAGVWEDYVRVILHRTAHLAVEQVGLTIRLVPNENFGLSHYIGDTDFNYIPVESLSFTINFSDMISKPEWWDDRITSFYLGEYTDDKYTYFMESSKVSDLTGYSSTEIRKMVLKFREDIEANQWIDSATGSLITVVIY